MPHLLWLDRTGAKRLECDAHTVGVGVVGNVERFLATLHLGCEEGEQHSMAGNKQGRCLRDQLQFPTLVLGKGCWGEGHRAIRLGQLPVEYQIVSHRPLCPSTGFLI